jgi:glycosyltransferase involved in cell wall biosynthesis
MIDAFAVAVQRDQRLRLTMVGTGVMESAMRERCAQLELSHLVTVRPSATRAGIADYMREHAFLAISSQSETFCLVAIEALACGRPVIATKCGGPEETLADAPGCMLVDDSVEALADGLLSMASNKASNHRANELHEYARRNFDYGVVADSVIDAYTDCLANQQGRT